MIAPLLALAALVAPAIAQQGDCHALRAGVAPTPDPNTPEAFASFSYYDTVANSTVTPANYERFMVAGSAAIHSSGDSYVTYHEMDAYDVSACAAACDAQKDCASFNTYFQRHPTLAPGPACPNPTANVVVRCALFNQPMTAADATNHGQTRGPADASGDKFEVLMRGSNAYNRLYPAGSRVTVTATVTATATVTQTVCATDCIAV